MAPAPNLSAFPRQLYIYYFQTDGRCPETIDDERFVGTWREEDSCFVFFSSPADELARRLVRRFGLQLVDTYCMSYEQWQGGAMEPVVAGPVVLVPAGWQGPTPRARHRLVLDPGVVFGNGLHPTTRHCLQLLVKSFAHRVPHAVADLGTGTGVLALAAAALGAKAVLAVDLNGLAARTARRNVLANGLQERIVVVQGRADKHMDGPFDLVVSNIHYEVMRRMLDAASLPAGAQLILSGLLRSQARQVRLDLAARGIRIVEERQHDGIWHSFWAQMPEAGRWGQKGTPC